MTMWYRWALDNAGMEGEIRALIRVPSDSPWFDGHFPEAPVLPGIAQLAMAHDLICRLLGRRLPVGQISRVRFRQVIRPDQPLTLTIKPAAGQVDHSFRITGDDGLICSGLIRLAPSNPQPPSPADGDDGNVHLS